MHKHTDFAFLRNLLTITRFGFEVNGFRGRKVLIWGGGVDFH
jgi:hypothetical protein